MFLYEIIKKRKLKCKSSYKRIQKLDMHASTVHSNWDLDYFIILITKQNYKLPRRMTKTY